MTLKILAPNKVLSGNITSTNIPDETAWSAGTYGLGAVRELSEELWTPKADNTSSKPSHTQNADWQYLGPMNKLAAFDLQVGVSKRRVTDTYSKNPDSVSFKLDGLGLATAIAFDGLSATDIQIVATSAATGEILNYSHTLKNRNPYNGSLWRYFYAPRSPARQHVLKGLNLPANVTLDITINNPGGEAAVSSIVMGYLDSFGVVKDGAGVSNNSQSTFQRDLDQITMVSRPSSRRFSFPIHVSGGDYALLEALERHVSEAAYFICEARSYFQGYAKVNDYQLVASAAGWDTYQVELVTL